MAVLLLLCLYLTPALSFLSVDPTWLTSTFLKSESWKLINGDALGHTIGTGSTPTASLTFPGVPFQSIPNLGYGISKYEGDDSLYNEKFEVNRTSLTATTFNVLIQIQGTTELWVLEIRYIAINLEFPHKLVSFDNVPVNYGAGSLNTITVRSSSMQTYINNVNFTKQSTEANSNYTTFPTPLDQNKILLFMTSLYIQGDADTASNPYQLQLEVTAIPTSSEIYQIKVVFGIRAEIQRLHYSMIVFNQLDVESSKLYTLVYERVDFTKDGGSYQFESQFSENFIISLTDFNSPRILVAVDFKTDFGVLPNGEYGLIMKPSKPRNSNYLTPLSRFGFTIFYMKTWNCPDQTFFNLTTEKCEGCPVYFCIDCLNLTTCKQCEVGYKVTKEGDECFLCDGEGCVSCSAPFICSDCNETAGYVLIDSNNSCKLCDTANGYFPNTTSETCELCSLEECLVCESLYECSQCDISHNFTLNLSNNNCFFCDYQMNNFINNLSQCEPCTLNECLTCLSLTSCTLCNSNNSYYLNSTTDLCELCNLEECLECYSLTECLTCDENNNYWINSASKQCEVCVLLGCLECSAIDVCKTCNTSGDYGPSFVYPNLCATCNESCFCDGYYEPWLGSKCSSVCGDGLIRVDEECDDNNTDNDDGCSSECKIERHFICTEEPSNCTKTLYIESSFLSVIKEGCNGIIISLKVKDFSLPEVEEFIVVHNSQVEVKKAVQRENYIDIHLEYGEGYKGEDLKVQFDPGNILTIPYSPAIPAVYYSEDECQTVSQLESMLKAMQVFSYFILIISIISCKIVGLELFGVLQLSYFTLGSHDFIQIYLSPLANFKTFNGLNLLFLSEASSLPQSLEYMKVNATFLNNCNIMMVLLLGELILGFVLWLIGQLVRRFSVKKIGLRLLKQGFVTLLIFNLFNIGFSAGVHWKYADKSADGYTWSLIVMSVVFLATIITIMMMQLTDGEDYGEFKLKFKKNFMCRLYIPFTIVYRLLLSIYISLNLEYKESTLMVLLLSLMFCVYVGVNLPFIDAYENYRSIFVHFTSGLVLLVTNYYRNMKSNLENEVKGKIFVPALVELVFIVVCIVFSLIVLVYEIYWLVREWRWRNKIKSKAFKNDDIIEESGMYIS